MITPSLPMRFITSAMIAPISRSPLAEMVPTCATESSFNGVDSSPSAPPSLNLPPLSGGANHHTHGSLDAALQCHWV